MKKHFRHLGALALFLSTTASILSAQTVKTPMMGWASWNANHIAISDLLIKSTADSVISQGLKDVGYTWVNTDDGFFGSRDAAGNLLVNSKFPNGMRTIADYIHAKGLKAGIYSEAGHNTCAYKWDNDKINGKGAGLKDHEEQDLRLFFDTWDFDFIKVDYCGAEDEKLDEKTTYTNIANHIKTIATESGKDIYYNVCRWIFPGTWVTEIANSWRIHQDIHDNFGSIKQIIDENTYLSAYASPGHYNDMDMLQVGNGMKNNVNEEKTHFGMWSIMSSPLIIGCNLAGIPKSTLEIIKNTEVIAVNQDILGLQAQIVAREGNTAVYAKPLEVANGKIRAVALFNADATAKTIRVNFKDIQLSEKATVRDLWTHSDKGEFTGYYETSVPAHGTAMLRIEGESSFDKTRFQGEDAFMNNFSAISSANDFAKPQKVSAGWASGGYKMTKLGKSDTNWAEFRKVYSTTGGNYKLRIFYYSPENRNLRITVNGGTPIDKDNLNSGTDTRASVDIPIQLNQGNNVIRLTSKTTTAWAPDIDKIELIAAGSSPEADNFDKLAGAPFPTVSSTDNSNEIWYNIQFKSSGNVIQDMGDDTNLLTEALDETKSAQQWKVINSPAPSGNFKYRLQNKSGRFISFVSDSFQATTTASKALNFNIVATTNATHLPAWELKRQGASGNMNQFQYNYPAGSNLVNGRISEWTANDQNNPLVFIPVKTNTAINKIASATALEANILVKNKTLTVENNNNVASVDVYTVTGQKVFGKTAPPFAFQLSAAGYYVVTVTDKQQQSRSKKVVIY